MSLTIVMPVYNEGQNIQKSIEAIEQAVKPQHRLLIVYDFDQDNTLPVVRKLQKKFRNLKLIKNNIGNGRGVVNAIVTGFANCEGKAAVVMMADMADDPQTVNEMYEKIMQGWDIVCGSRWSKGGQHLGGPKIKTFLSWLADASAPLVIGVPTRDITNAFKMYRTGVLRSIKIESQGGFELSMEITLKAFFNGFKITEVGTVWHDRTLGQSRFRLVAWLPKYLGWYFWGIGKRLKLK